MEYTEEKNIKSLAILVTPDAQSTETGGGRQGPLPVLSSREIDENGSVYVEGVIAGIIGASVIALWFFVLDIVQGRPFHTPTSWERRCLPRETPFRLVSIYIPSARP